MKLVSNISLACIVADEQGLAMLLPLPLDAAVRFYLSRPLLPSFSKHWLREAARTSCEHVTIWGLFLHWPTTKNADTFPWFEVTPSDFENCNTARLPSSGFGYFVTNRRSQRPQTSYWSIYRCPKSLESIGILFITHYPHYMLYMFIPILYAFSQPLYHVCTYFAQHIGIDSSTTACNSLPRVTKISDFNSIHLCLQESPKCEVSTLSSNVNAIFSFLVFNFNL
jgi:hypothetical protein